VHLDSYNGQTYKRIERNRSAAGVARILIIEDDPLVVSVVVEALSDFNHVVEAARTGHDGRDMLLHDHYDLAIIDWDLPGVKGIDILAEYRKNGGRIPALFLTGLQDIHKKVTALDTGADDYLCKPFSYDELTARVAALLRRPPKEQARMLHVGELKVDFNLRAVTISGAAIALTAREFSLLELLASNPGQVFSSEYVVEKICPEPALDADHVVRQLVMVLRKKLTGYGHLIETVRGTGYRFARSENIN